MSTRTNGKKKGLALSKKIEPYLYLAPFAIGVLVFTLYPIINVVLLSFKENYNFITKDFASWGIGNYLYVLKDPYFLQAYKNTFMYVFVVIPISTCLSVVIATLLNQKIKFSGVFQTAYFLPMVTSTIAIGFAWRFMFNYKSGVINYLLSFLGVEAINWLQVPTYNFPALCIYGIWAILPFTIILLLSGCTMSCSHCSRVLVSPTTCLQLYTTFTISSALNHLQDMVMLQQLQCFCLSQSLSSQ